MTSKLRQNPEALQTRRAGFESKLRAEFRQSLRSLRERIEACPAP
jgi:hypothetical protein